MTRAEHIRALMDEYAQQRSANEAALEARIARTVALEPEIARLREESAGLALKTMRAMVNMKTQEERVAAAESMKKRGVSINREIRVLLKRASLPENTLELQYRCNLCRDTGYVGEAPSRFCDCFEKRLRLRQFEDDSMVRMDEQTFDTFDENFIPEANGQRRRTVLAKMQCEEYANDFPKGEYLNLLLTGEGGLGKTFLLNAIFERVISRGYSAVRTTAFHMFEAMRQQHFGNVEDHEFQTLIEAPLLLIDDLGTEPMMRNITLEYLFALLNERMAKRRHTVIATNFTPVQLNERYGERVASRLLDRMRTGTVRFEGKDLRRQ